LTRQLERARAGAGGLVLISGEPGIGKTRTAEQLAENAAALGAWALWGRCYEGEGAPAYWPWVQVLRALVRGFDDAGLRTALGADATELARMVPELRERLPHLPVPTSETVQDRFRLFDATNEFLLRAASERPLVLLLDDLHHADAPSLLLLNFLSRQLARGRVLVVATYRDTDIAVDGPAARALPDLARLAQERIVLRGLEEPDVARFISLSAGMEASAALAATVCRETGGNPFFIGETVRLLASEGQLTAPEAGPSQLGLAPSVSEVITRRLNRLSPACRQALAVAAIIGRAFTLGALRHSITACAAPGTPLSAPARRIDATLLDVLDEALGARVIVAEPDARGRYRFAHALVQETIHAGLSAAERARMHAGVGEALERATADQPELYLAELAYHFIEAAPLGETERAIGYARRAAERAQALLAFEDAARHFELALQVLDQQVVPDALLRCDLLLELGEAQNRAGAIEAARRSFQLAAAAARELRTRRGPGEIASQLGRAGLGCSITSPSATGQVDEELIGLLEEALLGLTAEDSPLRARVLGRLAIELAGPLDGIRRLALSREALDVARRLGRPEVLADALSARYFVLQHPEHLRERIDIADELGRLAEATNDDRHRVTAHYWHVNNRLLLGDSAGIDRALAAGTELTERMRQPYYTYFMALVTATRSLLEGRFVDAERLAAAALAIGQPVRGATAVQQFAAQMLALRREQGRLAELEPIARATTAQFPGIPAWRSVLASIYHQLGRAPEARRELDTLAAADFTDFPRDVNWCVSLTLLAEVAAALGDLPRAERLYTLLLPYASLGVVAGFGSVCNGSAGHYLGILAAALGRTAAAAEHFEAALAFERRLGARPWVAHTERAYARLLAARGRPADAERARALTESARATARELNLTRLTDLLQADAATPAPAIAGAAGPVPAGLTVREVEVLRLLAGGQTNAEIAAALVISLATVERHVFNIYRKIGARGRTEAAVFALQHGLTGSETR
ncbi:MAG: helix-turn-helix transcriptional regulator, partial [Dehalococcoidia bacterium]